MPLNTGGLNYEINVSGNWQAQVADFKKQITALETRVGKAGGAGGKGAGRGGDAVTKKLVSLDKQRQVLESERVSLLQSEVSALRQVEKITRKTSNADEQALKTLHKRIAFSKEQVRNARKRNKELTKAGDLRKKETAQVLKQDIIQRSKQARKASDAGKALEKAKHAGEQKTAKAQKAEIARVDRLHAQQQKIFDTAKTASEKAAKYNNISAVAAERNAKAAREVAIKRVQINRLVKEQGISQRAAAEQVGVTAGQAKQLKLNMWDAQHAARQFMFTFRRLVGILAIFTLARKIAQALGAAVAEMTRFNAELETAEISIASIVASVGTVRDAQGGLVVGADAFAASLDASRGIINQLKKDAIGSIATFEALVKAYQVAIGPGLAAGLDLEQIREVSKRLTEGAISLGVPLNQLSEEIRSLLQGTATARNTRIAVLFGGAKEANEAIRRAREEGNLFEVLQDKLRGVAQGAEAAGLSMNVLKSNLQDTIQILLAEGGIEQFKAVKEATLALSEAVKSTDTEGNIIFSPEALGIVQEVAGTLASMTQSFRDMTDTGRVLATIRNVVGAMGDTLRSIAPLVSAVFQGMVDGVNTVLAPLRLVGVYLREFAKAAGLQKINKGFLKAATLAIQVAVALVLWKKTLLFIQGLFVAGGLADSFRLVFMYTWQAVQGLRAAHVQMSLINIATAIWGKLITNASFAMAAVTGWITLFLGILAIVAVRVGWIDKLIGKFNNSLSDSDKKALDLEHRFSGVAKSLEDIDPQLKDINKQVKELAISAAKVRFLAGAEDFSKDVLENYFDRNELIKKATENEVKLIKKSEKQVAVLKEQRKALLGTIDIIQAQGKPGQAKEELEKLLDLNKKIKTEQVSIKIKQDEAADTARKINNLFEVRLDVIREEQRVAKLAHDEQISTLKAHYGTLAVKAQEKGQAAAELALAQLKVAVLKEQGKAIEDQSKALIGIVEKEGDVEGSLIKSLKAEEVRRDGLKGTEEQVAAIQAELDALEAPKLLITLKKQELAKAQKELNNLYAQREGMSFGDIVKESFSVGKSESEKALSKVRQNKMSLERDLKDLKQQGSQEEEDAALLRFNKTKSELEERRRATQTDIDARIQAEKTIATIKEQIRIEEAKAATAKINQQNELAEALRDLEKASLRASDELGDGFRLGAMEFVDSIGTAAEEFSEIVTGAFNDLAGTVGQVFKDAIDPRKDADLKTAFGEFFLNLAGQMVESLTQQLTAKLTDMLIEEGAEAVTGASKDVATQANTTAITSNTTASTANTTATTTLTTQITALIAAITGEKASTEANKLAQDQNTQWLGKVKQGLTNVLGGLSKMSLALLKNTFALLKNTVIAIANGIKWAANTAATIANTVATYASSYFAEGGLVTGKAKGGPVKPKGFASGGASSLPRPSSIPASDTVPAWLTPGEYVLTPFMVRQVGLGVLERWRKSSAMPSFKDAGAFISGQARQAYGFASGGSVQRSQGQQRQPATIQQVVLPVLPTTNENLDQMLHGGREAFTKNMNSVTYTGDPNKAKGW